ncbi:MAG: hypothetical protein N2319_00045 [Candidatus Kapabacteria bacterium]|nr:hypothetical protein [Candidatus Kapabacteria bacterium]
MQNVNIPFNGTNLDLVLIKNTVITENLINWNLQINTTPPTPPNFFSVVISYLDNNNEIKVIKGSVTNMQNLQTGITVIRDQTVRATFILCYCNPPKVVSDDVDIIIRRPAPGNQG